jgi:class 3 adenylate cyclase
VATCASCGRESADDFRFCPYCGAPLAAAEDRRTVTVLFCDLADPVGLEGLDPESLEHVLASYFDAAAPVIERHGGTVEKFIGDAVMAVFGVPVVRDDDAVRAVLAAAEVRDALAAVDAEVERLYARRLAVRIGVNTGEVATGSADRLATGDAVNVAARLEQAAAPGQILLGEQTMRLAGDAVEVEELEPLVLKGKSRPVGAFRLIAVRAARR